MVQVVILAPSLAVRAGLRALLEAGQYDEVGGGPPVEVIWEAGSLSELGALPPGTDLLLAVPEAAPKQDLERALRPLQGQIALLLVTDNPQDIYGLLDLPVRAWGLVSQDSPPEELLAAVRAVHWGLAAGTPALLSAALLQPGRVGVEIGGQEALPEPLTERESEVLQLLAQGLPNKQIAGSLGISEHTVKFHISSIYTKLGASNRTEAVRLGVHLGLVVL